MDKKEITDHDIKAVLEDLLMRAQFAKTEMCKTEPMTDNPPIFLVGVASDETNPDHDVCVEFQQEKGLAKPIHLAMIPLIHRDDVYDAYDDVVKALPIRQFEFVAVALEGYGTQNPEMMNATEYQRGDMEEDYKNNPFSDVREALILTAVDWEGTSLWSIYCTYRYDDHGLPMFDEPSCSVAELSDEGGDNGGRLADTLLATVKYMNLAVKTASFHDLLSRATQDKKEDK